MLLIENKKGLKVYTIKNKYLCENGVLNEKNVCNTCMKYMNKIHYDYNDNDYIVVRGYKVPLNECMRIDYM